MEETSFATSGGNSSRLHVRSQSPRGVRHSSSRMRASAPDYAARGDLGAFGFQRKKSGGTIVCLHGFQATAAIAR